MGAHYSTWVAALRPSQARALDEEHDADDLPIRAADGRVIFRPGLDKDYGPKALARASAGLSASSRLDLPAGSTDMFEKLAEMGIDLERRGRLVSCWRAPLGSLVDRRVAIPNGVRFLEGRACVRMRPARQERFAADWADLLDRLGGARGVRDLLAPYLSLDDQEDVVRPFLRAIERTLERCAASGRDLFLMDVDTST
jgi:hypothetical protein